MGSDNYWACQIKSKSKRIYKEPAETPGLIQALCHGFLPDGDRASCRKNVMCVFPAFPSSFPQRWELGGLSEAQTDSSALSFQKFHESGCNMNHPSSLETVAESKPTEVRSHPNLVLVTGGGGFRAPCLFYLGWGGGVRLWMGLSHRSAFPEPGSIALTVSNHDQSRPPRVYNSLQRLK